MLTILGLYLDGIVVIGGWVPELTFPGRGHVGSFDVDLALDARRIQADGYNSIRKRLRCFDAGRRLESTCACGPYQNRSPKRRGEVGRLPLPNTFCASSGDRPANHVCPCVLLSSGIAARHPA